MGTSAGFVGCLRDFKLGRRPVALHSDHDPTVMVRARASRFCGSHPLGLFSNSALATWHVLPICPQVLRCPMNFIDTPQQDYQESLARCNK